MFLLINATPSLARRRRWRREEGGGTGGEPPQRGETRPFNGQTRASPRIEWPHMLFLAWKRRSSPPRLPRHRARCFFPKNPNSAKAGREWPMGGDPDRTTGGSLWRGWRWFLSHCQTAAIKHFGSSDKVKRHKNKSGCFFKPVKIHCRHQTAEVGVPVIWRSAIRTSGGFYRANIESFSETELSSSSVFQRDSVLCFFFGLEYKAGYY